MQTFSKPAEKDTEAITQQHLREFLDELSAMQNAMEQKLPGLSGQLIKLNDLLRTYPETVALLRPEDIGLLMRGVIQESKVQFSMAKVAGRGAAKKDLINKLNTGSVSLDDIKF